MLEDFLWGGPLFEGKKVERLDGMEGIIVGISGGCIMILWENQVLEERSVTEEEC